MSKAALGPELELLLKLSHPNCSLQAAQTLLEQIPAHFNWSYFLERAIATNLAGYLLPYPELAEKFFPAFVLQKIKAYQQRILLHSTLLREALLELSDYLTKADIAHAVLKGWDLHFRYGISLKKRQISDIDLLIDPSNLDQLEKILKQLGYTTKRHVYKSRWHEKWLPVHAPLLANKGAIMIDIHTKAMAREHALQWDFERNQHEKIQDQNLQIPLLTRQNSELFLILHTLKHFESLHPLKAAQIQDLWNIDFELVTAPMDLKSKIGELQLFLKRTEQFRLEVHNKYDNFFVHNLSGEKLPFLLRCKRLLIRIKPKNGLGKSLILTYYDLFPVKKYLQNRFGQGPYLLLNLKRLQKTTR